MSTPTPITPKFLHIWDVTITREVDETAPEEVNGQVLPVTRKVKKSVVTRMGLKQPTLRELRRAELFYGTEFNRFVSMGFLPRSILINKHLDLTGGVLSEKERGHAAKLTERHAALESDLARLATVPHTEEDKKRIQSELASVRTELLNMNAANESVFSQTAEAKAQGQLSNWFSFFLVMIERAGQWHPYFEGETFEQREEFMWRLEETEDPFYTAAVEKIATYVYWYNKGADTPEQFRLMEEEMAKQAKERAEEEAAALAAKEAAAKEEVANTQEAAPTVPEPAAT